MIIKWRQNKANEHDEIDELLGKSIDKDGWMQALNWTDLGEIAKHEPWDYLEMLVMQKTPGSRERQELLILLWIANPNWYRAMGVNMTEVLFWED
jgi:hypothetical protein